MPLKSKSSRFKVGVQIVGDLFLGALVVLVIALPFYIRLSGSNLSYTPEPRFPQRQTNSALIPAGAIQAPTTHSPTQTNSVITER